MMEENNEHIGDIEDLIINDVEDGIIETLTKDRFFEILEEYGIDKDAILKKKKSDNTNFHKFNILIKKLHDENLINIIDALVFLEADKFKFKTIMDYLNSENTYLVRQILTQRYKLNSNWLKD